jgi:hypothetical protein
MVQALTLNSELIVINIHINLAANLTCLMNHCDNRIRISSTLILIGLHINDISIISDLCPFPKQARSIITDVEL